MPSKMNANNNELSDDSKLKKDYNCNNELPTRMNAIVQTKPINLINKICQTDNKIFCDVGIQCNLKDNNNNDVHCIEQELQQPSYDKFELIQKNPTEFVLQPKITTNNISTVNEISSSSSIPSAPLLRQRSVIKSVSDIVYEQFLESTDLQIIYDVLLLLTTFDYFCQQQTILYNKMKTTEFKKFIGDKILRKHRNDYEDKIYNFLQKITIPINIIQKYKFLKEEYQKNFIGKIYEECNEILFNYTPIDYVQNSITSLCNLKNSNERNTLTFSDVISKRVTKNKYKKSNQNNTNYLRNISSIATNTDTTPTSTVTNQNNYNICLLNSSNVFEDLHSQQHSNQLIHHDQTNSYNSSQFTQNNFDGVYSSNGNGNTRINNSVTTVNQNNNNNNNNNMNSAHYTSNDENNTVYSSSTLSPYLERRSVQYHPQQPQQQQQQQQQHQQRQQNLPSTSSSTFLSSSTFCNSTNSTIMPAPLPINEPSGITNYNLNISAVISAPSTTLCCNNSDYCTYYDQAAQTGQVTVPDNANMFLQPQLQQQQHQQQLQLHQRQQLQQYSQQQHYGNQYQQHRLVDRGLHERNILPQLTRSEVIEEILKCS